MKAVAVHGNVVALRHPKETEGAFLGRANHLHDQLDPVARRIATLRHSLSVMDQHTQKARDELARLLKENPDYA